LKATTKRHSATSSQEVVVPFAVLDQTTAAAAPVTTLGAPLISVGETLATLRAELKLQVVRDDVDDPRYNLFINKAYRKLVSMLTIQEFSGSLSIATVAAQPFYLLPQAVGYIKKLSLADAVYYPRGGIDLQRIDADYYRRLPVRTGQPEMYFRQGGMLVIWPTPDTVDTMALDFRIRPVALTADNHSPILPLEWHDALALKARHIAFRSLQMFEKAAIAQNDFVTEIREIEQVEAGEDIDLQPQISPFNYKRPNPYRGYSDDCDDRR
jgi:hypothetical protein